MVFGRFKKSNKMVCLVSVVIIIIIVVGFLTWLFISALTAEAEISLDITFNLPDFNSLENLPNFGYGDYAVSIDGVIAKTQSEENKIMLAASTAKMILGLMVMEEKPFSDGEKGETITITEDMYKKYLWYANNGGSVSKVAVGEEISEYDALVSVFLASSNNMADSLAEWAFSSLDNYREYASAKLKEWGINDTTIGSDASGFNENTTSTTSDLAKIGYMVLKNAVLQKIVGIKEYEVPVAGVLANTNKILGRNRIIGVKTGYIGDTSGYCLVSGYLEGEHIITIALLNAPTRLQSFNDSLEIAVGVQNDIRERTVVKAGEIVGYYDSWWAGPVAIFANEDLEVVGWDKAEKKIEIEGNVLKITIGGYEYKVPISTEDFEEKPSFIERILHVFGWSNNRERTKNEEEEISVEENAEENVEEYKAEKIEENKVVKNNTATVEQPVNGNCTMKYGYLMLINPNFKVDTKYIDARRSELVSVSQLYGIVEGNPRNGDNLLDAEAATHLNEMVKAYEAEYPGHTLQTRSCYRARGTTCGRLCAATGTSDHHTGLTCDLIDPAYGTSLNTDTYNQHIDWQWLHANSYKYGFIDRFPAEWAGGSMSEPLNVDENGSTGLFETWHYRYVGVGPATEIATGKYNNGKYDSLEHYLKARGMVSNLKTGSCK